MSCISTSCLRDNNENGNKIEWPRRRANRDFTSLPESEDLTLDPSLSWPAIQAWASHLPHLEIKEVGTGKPTGPHLSQKLHQSVPCATWKSLRKMHQVSFPLRDFPSGPVVKKPSANAGDMSSILGPERSHMLRGNWARGPQMLSPCATTTEACPPQSPCSTAREATRT